MENDTDSSDSNANKNKTPPKVTCKKTKYMQKYNAIWEHEKDFEGWLSMSKKGKHLAYCNACDTDLLIGARGKKDLERHRDSAKHIRNVKGMAKQRTLLSMPHVSGFSTLEKQAKEGEIRLAAFVAEHNLPFKVMEHLPKLMQSVCKDSTIAKTIACSRTKTTAIVKKVTGLTSSANLNNLLRENKFSLIADESTDIGCMKHLCLVVRMVINSKVMDSFFGLIQVQDATADSLYEHVTKAFNEADIPYKINMIGFAADGANVMMGAHHSLSSKLKEDIPHLFIMKCICHSFHLCASYACAKLPKTVETLARDVYNYFQSSPKRAGQLKEFQEFVNVKPHKMLHPSQTRWLSLQTVVVRLLEQIEALKLYFTEKVFSDPDRLGATDTILQMLNDPINKLYLEFLEFVLELFNNLNKEMQSEQPKLHKLHSKISTVLRTFLECYISESHLRETSLKDVQYKNPSKFVPIEKMYLGAKVTVALASTNTHNVSLEQLNSFRLRCLEFLIESVHQIYLRFSFNNKVMTELEFLDPKNVMDKKVQSIATICSMFPNLVSPEQFQPMDTEWRLLRNTPLTSEREINVEEFWKNIRKLERGDGTPMFPLLCNFINALLCLPHSSAMVERVFSEVNLLKTKQRNSLSTDTIVGLLHTKRLLSSDTCYNFEITNELRNKMNVSIYED